jgi:hypothetical protein
MRKLAFYGLFLLGMTVFFMNVQEVEAQTTIKEYRSVYDKDIIPYNDYLKSKPVDENEVVVTNQRINGKVVRKETWYAIPYWDSVDVNGDVMTLFGSDEVYMFNGKVYVNLRKVSAEVGIELKYENKKLNIYHKNRELSCRTKKDGKKIEGLNIIQIREVVPQAYEFNLNALRDVVTKFRLGEAKAFVEIRSLAKQVGLAVVEDSISGYKLYTDAYLTTQCVGNNSTVKKIAKPTKEQIQSYLEENLPGFLAILPDGTKDYVNYKIEVEKGHGTIHGKGLQQFDQQYQNQFQEPHDFRIKIFCTNEMYCNDQGVKIFKVKEKQGFVLKSLINKFPKTKFFGYTSFDSLFEFETTLHWTNYVLKNKTIDGYYQTKVYASTKPSSLMWDDFTPPTEPKNVVLVDKGLDFLDVKWDKSIDNVGVVGYEVYVDGKLYVTMKETSVHLYNLQSGTSYEIEVIAIDRNGNRSEADSNYYSTDFDFNNF